MTDVTSLDSGFDVMEGTMNHSEASIHIRVTMPEDPSFQTIFIIRPLDLVWTLKQKVLDSVTKELKDAMNYGFFCPPSNNRVGKYLDEERPIKEYPLSIPIGLLEFKYKRKFYKTDLNPLKLKKMHTPSELKIFMELVRRGDIDAITAKMSKGLDPNFNSVGKGDTPMTLAATLPRPGAFILALVGGGAFIDYRNRSGMTPLHVATMVGNKDAVRILLDLGSSPNYKDSKGLTPLSYATMKDTSPLCIQWLLQERADIGRRDENGWMEIHHACEHGLTQHLEQLLYYGADRNAPTLDSNETPLHICARFNQADCAHLLLLRGADKALKNKSNQTPEQVAQASGHESVAKCITDFRPEQVELFSDVPKYNEKRRGTISMVTLRNLQRSRSNPNLLQQLFQQDPVLSATVSQATGVQYVSNGLVPNGVKNSLSHARPIAADLFGTGTKNLNKNENLESSNRKHIERIIELRRPPAGFGFILRGPIDPPGSCLNFMPTPDIPARQYIESVDAGGAAENAGLEAGDFILEINGQSVLFESHKDCVQLMRNCGELLKLKVVKIRPDTPRIQSKIDHNGEISVTPTKSRDSVTSNSLTSSMSSQTKSALAGLEALENLDATLDNYDGIVVHDKEDEVTLIVPPDEFTSEILPSSEKQPSHRIDFFPPPPVFHDSVADVEKVEFEIPELKMKDDDKVPTLSSHNSVYNNNHQLEMLSEPEVDYNGGVSRKLSEEKVLVGPAVIEDETGVKPEEGGTKKKSASLPFAAASVEVARKNPSEESSRTTTLSKTGGISNTVEVQNRKKYPAPNVPTSPTKSPSKVAAASVIIAASVKTDDTEKPKPKVNQSSVSTYSEKTSSANSAPAPPPPPPPLPPPGAVGTLPRSKPPESSDGEKSVPTAGRKQLEETQKREDSHAALMAAVLKRKNILDSADSDQLAESIDARVDRTRKLQKTVYRADNTKEVKSPPTTVPGIGLLVSPDGNVAKPASSSVEEGEAGFSAEAEKIRQAFLLKKSTAETSPPIASEKNGEISSRGTLPHFPAVAAKAESKPVVAGNGLSNGGEVKTLNRTNVRPVSVAVTTSQPVLADIASIVAQKALERQKKDEANLINSQAKSVNAINASDDILETKHVHHPKSMFEKGSASTKPLTSATLPRQSTVYTSGNIKTSDSATISKISAKSPPAISTLQPKKFGSSVTVISSPKTTSPTVKRTEQSNPSYRNSSIFTSSTSGGEKAASSILSPRVATTLSKRESTVETAPGGFIPPPVEFATPAESNFSNDVYPSATLRSVSKSVQSNSVVFRARGSTSVEQAVNKGFQDRSISTWNEKDIGDWLDSLDYSEYRAIFAERKITGSTLVQLKDTEMESMGIKKPLHRIRIEKEIRRFVNKK